MEFHKFLGFSHFNSFLQELLQKPKFNRTHAKELVKLPAILADVTASLNRHADCCPLT